MRGGLTNWRISVSLTVQTLFNAHSILSSKLTIFQYSTLLFFSSLLCFCVFFFSSGGDKKLVDSHSLDFASSVPRYFSPYNYDARGRIGRESDRRERGGGEGWIREGVSARIKSGNDAGRRGEGERKKCPRLLRECESTCERAVLFQGGGAKPRHTAAVIIDLGASLHFASGRALTGSVQVRRRERHICRRHCHCRRRCRCRCHCHISYIDCL